MTDAATPPPGAPLRGRVVLVTGGSRGIGAATARLAGASGAAVGVNYHASADRAAEVVRDIEAGGGRALAVRANVSDTAQVEVMAAALRREFGPVDTLVLNATGHQGGFAPGDLLDRPFDEVEALVTEQMRAVLAPSAAVYKDMLELGHGCVVVIGSGMARHPFPAMGPLSIAKAAGEAVARVLAAELGPHGIRVNVVAPGFVDTEASAAFVPPEARAALAQRTPLRRVAEPADVAGAAVMLMSEHAGFITGQCVDVTGGAV